MAQVIRQEISSENKKIQKASAVCRRPMPFSLAVLFLGIDPQHPQTHQRGQHARQDVEHLDKLLTPLHNLELILLKEVGLILVMVAVAAMMMVRRPFYILCHKLRIVLMNA
ncbi:hypothetical protein HMPREF9136_0656 [Prevotella dentalis DSM 3688]|uniref:Uncharacterized protein n=1 Tax=Prevotella dentalis (strain ATCC 49559 / DSM 3688 / JCM 13448 / NCTC 12043 / ES 2772) TaxID=908937 RepID=F9D1C8_PREDD|nr:hypothetical protein HMPREF9136_0656 [Prevotella dentalis DSM 3688]